MQLKTPSSLSYRVDGCGDAIVLVNDSLQDDRLWEHQAKTLSRRYRVVRLTLRGQSAGLAPQVHARELCALLAELRIERCGMAGHGQGALAAASFARQYPAAVSRLALVDPVVRRAELNAVQEVWHLESLLQWLQVGYGEAVRNPETVRILKECIGQQMLALNGGTVPASMPLHGPDLMLPSTFGCPLLILVGELETMETIEVARMLFGRVPEGRFQFVPRASRRSPTEAPEAVTRELMAFF